MSSYGFLPEHLQGKVRGMPESSYGATRVTAILDDGTRISDVYVAWGKEIVKIDSELEYALDVSKIVDVEHQEK